MFGKYRFGTLRFNQGSTQFATVNMQGGSALSVAASAELVGQPVAQSSNPFSLAFNTAQFNSDGPQTSTILSAEANLRVSGSIQQTGTTTMQGGSTLSTYGSEIFAAGSAMAGDSSLAVTANEDDSAIASMNGSSSLSVTASAALSGIPINNSSSTFSAMFGSSQFDGKVSQTSKGLTIQSNLRVFAVVGTSGKVTMTGTSSLSAYGSERFSAGSTMAAAGAWTASALRAVGLIGPVLPSSSFEAQFNTMRLNQQSAGTALVLKGESRLSLVTTNLVYGVPGSLGEPSFNSAFGSQVFNKPQFTSGLNITSHLQVNGTNVFTDSVVNMIGEGFFDIRFLVPGSAALVVESDLSAWVIVATTTLPILMKSDSLMSTFAEIRKLWSPKVFGPAPWGKQGQPVGDWIAESGAPPRWAQQTNETPAWSAQDQNATSWSNGDKVGTDWGKQDGAVPAWAATVSTSTKWE